MNHSVSILFNSIGFYIYENQKKKCVVFILQFNLSLPKMLTYNYLIRVWNTFVLWMLTICFVFDSFHIKNEKIELNGIISSLHFLHEHFNTIEWMQFSLLEYMSVLLLRIKNCLMQYLSFYFFFCQFKIEEGKTNQRTNKKYYG